MPYADERAGLAAIQAIADSAEFDEFPKPVTTTQPRCCVASATVSPQPLRKFKNAFVAIDGSQVYDNFPGRLPDTHAGVVSLGVVVIKLSKLSSLGKLPYSGAVNPRELSN